MTTGRDNLTKAETVTIAAIEDGMPALVEVRESHRTGYVLVGEVASNR